MKAEFTVEIVYRVRCSVCESVADVEDWEIFRQQEFPMPTLPLNWHVLDGQPICDKHKIKVGKAAKVWEKGA